MCVSLSSLTIAGGEDSFLVFSLSSLTIAGGEDAFVRFYFSGGVASGRTAQQCGRRDRARRLRRAVCVVDTAHRL